ncbi:MAG: kinase, partial [Alphaproteobacteria bacterium]|nr:kinase [Alphaproteobacteria bacterium]
NGAGDAFAAGALDALVAGATTDAALERGLAAGAFTAASVGSNADGLSAATLDQMARD